MSRRTVFYGGSPGPPIDERSLSHHAQQLYGHAPPNVSHVYDPSSREMNGTGSVYYPGRNAIPSNFVDLVEINNSSYPYGVPQSNIYYAGASPYYYPSTAPNAYNVESNFSLGTQYTEWSSHDYPTPSDLSPPENSAVLETNSPTPEARSSSNESAGKSRRFSKQRNVKDNNGGTPRSNASKPHFKSLPKHEIRFSHQKTTAVETAAPKPVENEGASSSVKESEPVDKEDARFSIIRSIGKREIDTGFEEPQKTTQILKKKPEKEKFKGIAMKKRYGKSSNSQSSESQLSVLLDQLTDGTYECMVCCDRVKQHHAIWNCGKCYHVFHMGCIKKWARSPSASIEKEGWRCPSCQNINKKFPNYYKCFCGKVKEPEWNRRETPHSCGEVCSKKRSNNDTCTHPCNILCHPGPCPPCPASVIKKCLCGKSTSKVRCSQQKPLTCSEECGKYKNCRVHKCDVVCHTGECNACDVVIEQVCFCGKDKRNILCGSEEYETTKQSDSNAVYTCGSKCDRIRSCGSHTCHDLCHEGPCEPCPLRPSEVLTCPCTQSKIANLTDEEGNKYIRTQCTDPIPVCDKICSKPLSCGGDKVHTCNLKCHIGPCPPCADNVSTIHCRCKKSEDDVPCTEIPDVPYVCDRRCNKKRKCGRHKCGKTCCTDTEHLCSQICGRKLECKLHRCEETCHRGNCHTCYNVSFDDLSCHCGAESLLAPIPCGTKPPECHRTCMRPHACFHPINHNCHSEEKCIPCVVLLKKQCNCGKVFRNNIPCHQTNVSCGSPCKKVLSCGHNCLKPCHQGPCMEEDDKCTQPCSIMRVECIHPCALPCHQGRACPPSPCKAMVTLKCSCGNREMQVECSDGGAAYQRLSSEAFARQQLSKGTVDISNLFHSSGKQKVLPCDENCSAIERNRRLAEALNIEESSKESDSQLYSSFLQMWVRRDQMFIKGIEEELTNIVDAVAWLGKTKCSHAFPSMRREKRQVVHELAEAFNCKSLSVDEEPNRSVYATATKGISRVPSVLLSDTVTKKALETSAPKLTESQNKAEKSADGRKRLLSSMKLVSLTSTSPASDNKALDSNSSSTKRPASIPRMPSYPMSGKTLSSSSNVGKSYSSSSVSYSGRSDFSTPSRGDNRTNTSQNPSSARSRNETYHTQSNSIQPLRRTTPAQQGSKKEKEPEIDYFDMTG